MPAQSRSNSGGRSEPDQGAVRGTATPANARVGQQGTLTRVWAERGSRPAAPRDQRYSWAYLFGAICPARGTGAALVLPAANADMMNLHLAEISACVAPHAHAVLVIDEAGWHQPGRRLKVPKNITLLHLPPYSPELNPVENVWAYLRGNKLSNRVFETYDAIVEARLAMPGTGSSPSPIASPPSAHDPGPRSVNDTVRIREPNSLKQHQNSLGTGPANRTAQLGERIVRAGPSPTIGSSSSRRSLALIARS